MKSLLSAIGCIMIITLLWSCAQVRGVSGGEKDLQAPVVVKASPKNLSTEFTGRSFTLEFDEFVQAGSLLQNLVVSPPLRKNPKISIRGKAVTLTLQEELKENTTYVFQFGEGISDIRESNLLGDYSYVVSTGNRLDSLVVTGRVHDAWDGSALKGLKAMLFDAGITSDSVGVKPLYYSKTDANGDFTIPFLKDGNYRIEILEDINNNMLYDEGERVAFLQESMRPTLEKDTTSIKLLASVPNKKLTFISDTRADSSGFFAFTWPQWCDLPQVNLVQEGFTITQARDPQSDSVFHWIKGAPSNQDLIAVVSSKEMEMENDSIDVMFYSGTYYGFRDINPIKPKINSTEKFTLFSRYRIEDVLNDNINFRIDSLPWDPEINFLEETNSIEILHEWKADTEYSVLFNPGSIFAPDKSTCDSLFFPIDIAKNTDFGTLSVSFSEEYGDGNILLLTDASGKTVFRSDISKIKSTKINFLNPGEYTARIFRDDNGNLKWDSADYHIKTQPEPLLTTPQKIQIRANWEVVLNW